MGSQMENLGTARSVAAQHLSESGYAAEAALVISGQGDGFAEVRIALSLLAILKAPAAPPAPKPARRFAGEEC